MSLPLKTANKDEKKAEEIPNNIPVMNLYSLWKINDTPTITIIPNTISYQISWRLNIKGSINDVKKAPLENMAKAIETLDWSIDSKKVTQCRAIIMPPKQNFNRAIKDTFKWVPRNFKYKNIKTKAINILNHTNVIDSKEINFPKIAVNPAIKTRKWRWIRCLNLALSIVQ